MIRVSISSPSPVARAGLEALLSEAPDIEVVAEDPDVIVADWDRSGDELPQDLLDAAPNAAVILLANERHAWTADVLRSGVRGVLARDAAPNQIIAAVEAAAAGLVVLQAENIDTVLAPPRRTRVVESLSPREMEVLAMLAEGLSNKVIAYRLGISEHTVKFHVTSIMTKLNAGSRTEAVTMGIRQGLVLL